MNYLKKIMGSSQRTKLAIQKPTPFKPTQPQGSSDIFKSSTDLLPKNSLAPSSFLPKDPTQDPQARFRQLKAFFYKQGHK